MKEIIIIIFGIIWLYSYYKLKTQSKQELIDILDNLIVYAKMYDPYDSTSSLETCREDDKELRETIRNAKDYLDSL